MQEKKKEASKKSYQKRKENVIKKQQKIESDKKWAEHSLIYQKECFKKGT